MMRLVVRKFYSQRCQIDISCRHEWAPSAVKHFCTQYEKFQKQPKQIVFHMDALRNSFKTGNKDPVNVGLDDKQTFAQRIVSYVKKTTYMDDVRRAQARVMDIKKKLLTAGKEKRSLMKELEDLRNNLNHIYKDMKINRSNEIYLDLARQEFELCKMEKQYTDMYKRLDKEEQYLFAEFSTAINESYEKEKHHTNFIKVISIIGSVTSSLVALVLSLLFHAFQYKRFNSIKPFDDDVLKSINIRLGSVEEAITKSNRKPESWKSYLHRNTRWLYCWAMKTK